MESANIETVEVRIDYLQEILTRLETLEKKIDELSSKPRYDSLDSGASAASDTMRFEIYKKSVKISGGATITNKDKLKEKKCKWNSSLKSWITTRENGKKLAKRFQKKLGEKCIVEDGVLVSESESESESE